MYQDEEEDKTIYKVVLHHEEQFSIWPAYRENPLGWRDAGKSGIKPECLAYIKEVWTDMRPHKRSFPKNNATDFSQAKFPQATGIAHVVGNVDTQLCEGALCC